MPKSLKKLKWFAELFSVNAEKGESHIGNVLNPKESGALIFYRSEEKAGGS